VKYIFVFLDAFLEFIKLCHLKAVTSNSCLNKLVNDYFVNDIVPKSILSDNTMQFRSPQWAEHLRRHCVEVRFSLVRHPESNPSERFMQEISKFAEYAVAKITRNGESYCLM
jgi:transposase InsO family protein